MKYLVFIFFLLFSVRLTAQQVDGVPRPRPANCQTEDICPRKTIFHETNTKFKTLSINSINYDKIILCRIHYLLSWRIGINYYTFTKIRSFGVPVEINFMLGGGALMLETGLGLNSLYVYRNYKEGIGKYDDSVLYLATTGRIGLRYQKKRSIFFRLGYTPMYSLTGYNDISVLKDKRYISMLGFSVGYCFK